MAGERKRYVHWKGHEYGAGWHSVSHEAYVYRGTWKDAGRAYDMQAALDTSISWRSSHVR